MGWSIAAFAAYRIATALPVLRWPLAGTFIAVLGDLGDLFLYYSIGQEWNYQQLDKVFDLSYLTTFLMVAMRWSKPEKQVAVGLFSYRMVGFVLFETLHARSILIFFPNVFDLWFIIVVGLRQWQSQYTFTVQRLALWLGAATALKLFHEYTLHVGKWFDSFTIMDVVRRIQDLLWPF